MSGDRHTNQKIDGCLNNLISTMKQIFIVLAVLVAVVSCDRNNEPQKDTDHIDESMFEELYYEQLLMNLSDRDTLESGEVRRVPSLGDCLYSACPDEFYLLADNSELAYSHFLDLMIPDGVEDRITVLGNERVLMMNEATISFRAANTDGRVAEVDLDIPEIPGLKKVYFMTEESWPVNSDESPFELGQIWRKGNEYWICVKDSRQGIGRLLLVREAGGNVTGYSGDEQEYFEVCNECASKETWLAYKEFRRKFTKRLSEISEAVENMLTSMQDQYLRDGTLPTLHSLLSSTNEVPFQVGAAAVTKVHSLSGDYGDRYGTTYYVAEYDYYDTAYNNFGHSKYKSYYLPLFSQEMVFWAGDFNNNPLQHGWELVINE